MNEQEARDDEREALAQVIANAFFAMQAGQEWNAEGTSYSQPVPSGGDMDLAVSILAAGYRKHPEPEWEYAHSANGYWNRDETEFTAEGYYDVGDDARGAIARRTKPGPWEPIA